jgi:peptidyl-prolyl cis-trans isomerase SurA
MRKLLILSLSTGCFVTTLKAQNLFTFGNTPVSKQEFLRVYQKNSLNKAPDFGEPALREYLDLYSLFRMKVREAELMKVDTISGISAELDSYRRQLAKNYLTDKDVRGRLVTEAYDRMKEEVRVAHIMVACSPNALAADTAKAYAKIDSLYRQAMAGKSSFASLAENASDDRNTRAAGGDIGYLTALQTLYPFENAAYSTPIGKISKPFRTQFGYHIVKVLDKRPARGEVQVAQILINAPKSKGDSVIAAARNKAADIHRQLKSGASFESMVTKYSEDKYSVNEKGVMAPFGVGRMTPDFENASFALKNPGDISQPIQTEYGFHIVKLISKNPIKPFDSLRDGLQRKVDNDARAQMAHDIYFEKIKKQNNFKEYPQNLQAIIDRLQKKADTGVQAGTFTATEFRNMNAPVFELGGNKYLQSDLMSFAENLTRGRFNGDKGVVLRDIFKIYVDRTVNDFEEHRLADANPDFKNLMDEYRNGIMLFELTDRNVWSKASRDTVGLKNFYNNNKTKYQWEPGFTGVVYKFKNETAMKNGLKVLAKDKNIKDEDAYKNMNSEAMPDAVSIQRGHFEYSRFTDVPQAKLAKGKISEAVKNADGTYTVVKVDETFAQPTGKTLDEARGYAVAEYQDFLEKQWNAELRKKYPVKVEDNVFRSMVK